MSVIFSHALNAIKNNSDLAAPILSKPATLISKTAESSRSILSRIKKTSKSPNSPRVIRKQSSEKNIMKVSHKLIKKPTKSIVLKTKPINNSDVWTHDLYTAPPQIITQYYRVFIRNLPEFVDSDLLKKSINEKFREYVLGIKIEKDTAEINFSQEDAAKKATEALNGKVIVGQKIKAALISEINPQFGSGTRKRSKINKMEIEDNGENENFDKKMSIDEDKKKSISILERIRKNR